MFEKQLEAFGKFKQLKVGAIFMEMGTGKTKVALDLVNYNNVDLLLYFTPFSTIDNIQVEINKWGVNCNYEVVGFETISSSDKKYLSLLDKVENKRVFIIADESIFIKNAETKRYSRLLKIREKCEYALILNGTPAAKSEWDLYNQFNFLSYEIFGMSEIEFNNTFFDKIIYKKRYESPNTFYKFSEVNAAQFAEIIEPYVFKAELDLDVKESKEIVRISSNLDEYKEHKLKRLNEMRNSMSLEKILVLLTELSILASCDKCKLDRLTNYIRNKRVIVYCNYLKEVEQISNTVDCYTITGDTNKSERKEIIERFKNDSKPLIMTFGVGSYSLNLQFCNEIVYSSINFDYSKMLQSMYRIKRIGQNNDIKYTFFLVECGINNMMLTSLKQKKNLSDLIKAKVKEGDTDWVKNI